MSGKQPVAVVTDSVANLPEALVERLGIHVIPVWLRIGDAIYRDGVDIQPLEFFRRLRERAQRVGTSQPSLGEFLEVYQRAKERAEAIVSVHLASRYSGVFSSARAAAAEMVPFPIEVLDSGTIAMAQGFVVLAAARMAEAGAPLKDVVERVRSVTSQVDLIAALESLEWAARGGRLAVAARMLDNVLSIKPLVRVRGNEVGIIGQARTRAKAIRRLLDELADQAGDAPVHVAVLYSETVEEAYRIKEEVLSRVHCAEIHVQAVTPVLGVHAGPGAVGLAFYIGE